jgi:hypothetical protein
MVEYQDCESRSACDDVREELAELQKRGEWQPIESAPKDGTLVLICFADGEIYIARNEGKPDSQHNDWWDQDGLDFGYGASQPTHWMPLPELPKP